MAAKAYEITISASISLQGTFTGDSVEDAIKTATIELLQNGAVSDINVERHLLLDDDSEYCVPGA